MLFLRGGNEQGCRQPRDAVVTRGLAELGEFLDVARSAAATSSPAGGHRDLRGRHRPWALHAALLEVAGVVDVGGGHRPWALPAAPVEVGGVVEAARTVDGPRGPGRGRRNLRGGLTVGAARGPSRTRPGRRGGHRPWALPAAPAGGRRSRVADHGTVERRPAAPQGGRRKSWWWTRTEDAARGPARRSPESW